MFLMVAFSRENRRIRTVAAGRFDGISAGPGEGRDFRLREFGAQAAGQIFAPGAERHGTNSFISHRDEQRSERALGDCVVDLHSQLRGGFFVKPIAGAIALRNSRPRTPCARRRGSIGAT
jgi:hypothetical protein